MSDIFMFTKSSITSLKILEFLKNDRIYKYTNIVHLKRLTAGHKMSSLSVCALEAPGFHIT